MKAHLKIYFIFVYLFLSLIVSIYSNESDTTIIYEDETKLQLIGKQIYVLEDVTRNLTIEDMQNPQIQKDFTLYTKNVFLHRSTANAFWMKISVENLSKKETWLEFGSNSLWYIDYYRKKEGQYILAVSTGSLRPYKNRAYPTNLFWLPLGKESIQQTVYIRLQTQRPLAVPIQIGSTFSLSQNKGILDSTMVGFICSMFVLFLYNLFLFFSTKDKTFLWYICYVFAATITAMFLNHYAFLDYFLEEETAQLFHRYPLAWINFLFVFAGFFAIQFLNLSKSIYAKTTIQVFILYFSIIVIFFECFEVIPHYLLVQINQLLTVVYMFTLVGIGFYNWLKKGNKNARFYCLGWVWLLVSMVFYYALINGFIKYGYLARSLNLFGLGMESLLFSFALGDRINIMREEAESWQKTKILLAEEQNQILEQKISERTKELREDIEKRRIIEFKLAEFKQALDEHSIVAIYDTRARLTYANDKFCKISKYSLEELINKDYRILNSSFNEKKIRKEIWSSIKKGKIWKGEMKNNTKFGKSYWVNITIVPFMNLIGNPIQFISIGTDVTDFKETEDSLFQVSEKFRETFENASIGICHSSISGNFFYVNSTMCRIFGYSVEELLQRSFRDVTHPDDLQKNLELYNKAVKGEIRTYSIEKRYIRKDQSIVWVNLQATYVHNKEGIPQYIVAVAEDISHRKQIQSDLITAKIEAEAGNLAKSEFIATMSHEIRTPLNGIIAFTDLLLRTPLNETQNQYMNIVLNSANSLLNLLNSILDFSKIETGMFEMNIEKMNLINLIHQVTEVVKFKTKEKKINFIINLSDDLPKYIYSDSIRLGQILSNLLGNALKFTKQGYIEIKVEIIKSTEGKPNSDNAFIFFSVSDSGIGILKENQERIFQPFTQGDSSIARKYGGTGLGLTISNKLLALMNSKLEINSEPSKGSTFYFTLEVKIEKDYPTSIENPDSTQVKPQEARD